MSNSPKKDPRSLKPRTKRVYIISSITFAIHRGDVPFTIYNLNQKKLKTTYLIKKKKKTNQSSHLLPPSMSNSLEKNQRSPKPRTKRVYVILIGHLLQK